MKQIYKIDTNGYLLEVLIVDETSLDFVMPKDCINIKPQDGLHKPQWNGTKWIEGDPSAVLNLAKSIKISELTSAYNKANETDIAYMSTTFQANYKSQGLIVSVLSAGSVPSGFYWLDVNNKEVAMTYADLQGLSGAILTRSQANFTKLQTLKANVKACTTQSDLDKTVW